MKLIAVINYEIALGESLNALAHMSLGIGHLLDGVPDISVFFASSSQVRQFRAIASKLGVEQQGRAVSTDFSNTMSGGRTDEQLAISARTAEDELTYYGTCLIGDEIDAHGAELTRSYSRLAGYEPHSTAGSATLLALRSDRAHNPPAQGTDKKISMLLSSAVPLAQTINSIVLASLSVGRRAEYSSLNLIDFADKSGVHHANISWHPFLILKPQNPEKHNNMAQRARATEALVSEALRDRSGRPLVTVVFGDRAVVDEVIPRKQTRLFNDSLKEGDLENASHHGSA